jgi:cytochrome P450
VSLAPSGAGLFDSEETHLLTTLAAATANGLPPGPETGVLAQTVAFHRDPLGFLTEAHEEFGDVFTLRLLTARPLLVVSDPEAVPLLLDGDPDRAAAGSGRRMILPFASARSVFGADAGAHQAARQRIAPAMSAEAIDRHRPEMEQIARRHAAAFPADHPFQLLPRMREITDEVFVRLVLGVRDARIAADLIVAIQRMLWTPGNPPLTLPGKGDGAFGELGQMLFERRQAPVARHLARAVDARREEGAAGEDDVLGRMVAAEPPLQTSEIVDELMSLLMAAQEPPSIALTWLLDRLGRDPLLADRYAADPRGELADRVVRETLRLRPPASGVLRRLSEPLDAGGRRLPPGLNVLVSSLLVHRDPRLFPEPERFRPERWQSGEVAQEAYFPFGGGARRCIGEALARAEIETVVPAVLAAVRLEPIAAEPEPMVQRATVLVPKQSLLVQRKDDKEESKS